MTARLYLLSRYRKPPSIGLSFGLAMPLLACLLVWAAGRWVVDWAWGRG